MSQVVDKLVPVARLPKACQRPASGRLRLPLLQRMPVDVNRNLNRTVAHLALDVVDILALVELQGPVGMPQVVEADVVESSCSEGRSDLALDEVAGVVWSAGAKPLWL